MYVGVLAWSTYGRKSPFLRQIRLKLPFRFRPIAVMAGNLGNIGWYEGGCTDAYPHALDQTPAD